MTNDKCLKNDEIANVEKGLGSFVLGHLEVLVIGDWSFVIASHFPAWAFV